MTAVIDFNGFPVWAQVVLSAIGLLLAIVALVRFNSGALWRHIAEMQKELNRLNREISHLRREKHNDRLQIQDLRVKVVARESEVNDLLEELERPVKYDLTRRNI
jgi:uncharacterized protein YwgA